MFWTHITQTLPSVFHLSQRRRLCQSLTLFLPKILLCWWSIISRRLPTKIKRIMKTNYLTLPVSQHIVVGQIVKFSHQEIIPAVTIFDFLVLQNHKLNKLMWSSQRATNKSIATELT